MTIFEKIIRGDLPASVVHRDATCIALMDIHPMSAGHVLVCPLTAVRTLEELDATTRAHLWEVAVRIAAAQRQALTSRAQHFLVNDGPGASQTVPHVHIHVVPRYRGDSVRTIARLIAHVGALALPLPVSARKRARLDAQAAAIAAALDM